MQSLIKIEFLKLLSKKSIMYLCAAFTFSIISLIFFLKLFAPSSSFGSIVKTSIDTFSIVAFVIGALLPLTSFHQDIQQKTMKTILVTPVRRSKILFVKLFVSTSICAMLLIVLTFVSFLTAGLLFGFFSDGLYTSSTDNYAAFISGIIQIITTLFTTLFYSILGVYLLLVFRSLPLTLILLVLIRGGGEVITRSLIHNNNWLLQNSPFGILYIRSPEFSGQAILAYSLQLFFTIIYVLVIFYMSAKIFNRREF